MTVLGYVSGSIMYSYLLPKLFLKRDICLISDDGNPGAYNVFKYVGSYLGIAALLLDLFKGFYPVYKATKILHVSDYRFAFVLVAPVFGHAYSVFFKGHGGKGIAVSFGVLLGLLPTYKPVFYLAILYVVFSFILMVKPNYYCSVITYASFSVFCILLLPTYSLKIGCVLLACIVIAKHRERYRGEHISIVMLLKIKTFLKKK